MRAWIVALVSVPAMALGEPALAAKFRLDLHPNGENQTARMDAGIETVDSRMPKSAVKIIPSEDKFGKRGTLTIAVMNLNTEPANVGSESISITLGDGTNVAVVPYEKLLKEKKNEEMWAAIAVGLSAAANSYSASQAGYSSGSAAFSGSTYTPYGQTSTFGTTNYSGYNAGAAYSAGVIARSENQAMFDRMSSQIEANRDALKTLLRTTTIDPGDFTGGLVTFEIPAVARRAKSSLPVKITVAFGGELHEFAGELKK